MLLRRLEALEILISIEMFRAAGQRMLRVRHNLAFGLQSLTDQLLVSGAWHAQRPAVELAVALAALEGAKNVCVANCVSLEEALQLLELAQRHLGGHLWKPL